MVYSIEFVVGVSVTFPFEIVAIRQLNVIVYVFGVNLATRVTSPFLFCVEMLVAKSSEPTDQFPDAVWIAQPVKS